jgi:hypothetical protein
LLRCSSAFDKNGSDLFSGPPAEVAFGEFIVTAGASLVWFTSTGRFAVLGGPGKTTGLQEPVGGVLAGLDGALYGTGDGGGFGVGGIYRYGNWNRTSGASPVRISLIALRNDFAW